MRDSRDPRAALFADFLLESQERLAHLESLLLTAGETGGLAGEALEDVLLELHTWKGNAGLVGLGAMRQEAHAMEELLEAAAQGGGAPMPALLAGLDRLRAQLTGTAPAAGSEGAGETPAGEGEVSQSGLRVAFSTLDGLVDRLEEMVIYRNRLAEALERLRAEQGRKASPAAEAVHQAYDELNSSLDLLRDGILRLRMVPLGTLFASLRRLVHDEAESGGKQVDFETAGGETPLDRGLLELASEALGHLVRNAVIHGLETPEERRRAGKPRASLRVAAVADTREVRIDVVDDGRGIQRAEVLEAAERRGDVLPAGGDPSSLLFLPGFSTRLEADLGSGRGIGLAVVREAVSRRGGRIEVFSEEGQGTVFRLRLPLSVSILRALMVASDGEDYVLPLSATAETFRLDPAQVHEINGGLVIQRREGLVPLLDLGFCLGTSAVRRRDGYAVLLEADGDCRAVGVGHIRGIREVVVRRLDGWTTRHPAVAGSTILGDGRAVLLLDPAALARLSPLARAGEAA